MRILFLQFFSAHKPPAYPKYDEQLGVLSSVLRQSGHATGLLALTGLDDAALRIKVAHFRPQMIYADISGTSIDLAHRTLTRLSRTQFLPAVCGGAYATARPAEALSIPGVQAVVIGEPEGAFPAYVQAHITGDIDADLPGVWVNADGAVVRNDVAPLTENLDALPDADRGLFAYQRRIDATGEVEISAGRGCPHFCAYCLNDWLLEIYEGHGTFVRRRSPDRICDEIVRLRSTFSGIERVRFRDHLFALDEEWLDRFVPIYRQRCGLPFRCHVRANALTDTVADRLAEGGTYLADVEVISGSDFVRNEVFDMDLTHSQIVAAFDRLAVRGIGTRAINYLGAPYASEMSIEETVELNRQVGPTLTEARVYYPFPGTRAAELCKENGWISNRGEAAFARNDSVLDMPNLPRSAIHRLARRFAWYVHHPRRTAWSNLLAWIATGPFGRFMGQGRGVYRSMARRVARRTLPRNEALRTEG